MVAARLEMPISRRRKMVVASVPDSKKYQLSAVFQNSPIQEAQSEIEGQATFNGDNLEKSSFPNAL